MPIPQAIGVSIDTWQSIDRSTHLGDFLHHDFGTTSRHANRFARRYLCQSIGQHVGNTFRFPSLSVVGAQRNVESGGSKIFDAS